MFNDSSGCIGSDHDDIVDFDNSPTDGDDQLSLLLLLPASMSLPERLNGEDDYAGAAAAKIIDVVDDNDDVLSTSIMSAPCTFQEVVVDGDDDDIGIDDVDNILPSLPSSSSLPSQRSSQLSFSDIMDVPSERQLPTEDNNDNNDDDDDDETIPENSSTTHCGDKSEGAVTVTASATSASAGIDKLHQHHYHRCNSNSNKESIGLSSSTLLPSSPSSSLSPSSTSSSWSSPLKDLHPSSTSFSEYTSFAKSFNGKYIYPKNHLTSHSKGEVGQEYTVEKFKQFLESIMKESNNDEDDNENKNEDNNHNDGDNCMDGSSVICSSNNNDDAATAIADDNGHNGVVDDNHNGDNHGKDRDNNIVVWPETLLRSPDMMDDVPNGILFVFDRMLDCIDPNPRNRNKNCSCFADLDDDDDWSLSISHRSIVSLKDLVAAGREGDGDGDSTADCSISTTGGDYSLDFLLSGSGGGGSGGRGQLVLPLPVLDKNESGIHSDGFECMMFPCMWEETPSPYDENEGSRRPIAVVGKKKKDRKKKKKIIRVLASADTGRKRKWNGSSGSGSGGNGRYRSSRNPSTSCNRNRKRLFTITHDLNLFEERNNKDCDYEDDGDKLINISNDDTYFNDQHQHHEKSAMVVEFPPLLKLAKIVQLDNESTDGGSDRSSIHSNNNKEGIDDDDNSSLSELFDGLTFESPSDEKDELGYFLDRTSLTEETSHLSYSS